MTTAVVTVNHDANIATSGRKKLKSAATKSASTSKSKRARGYSKATSLAAQPYTTTATWGKYRNWNVEPFKSALAGAVEAELKGLNGQTVAGEITIPGGTLRRRVKEVNAAAVQKGKQSVLYLCDFKHTKEGEKSKMPMDKANCN